jgi:hypothetical protein
MHPLILLLIQIWRFEFSYSMSWIVFEAWKTDMILCFLHRSQFLSPIFDMRIDLVTLQGSANSYDGDVGGFAKLYISFSISI